jgi:hypothetical protein
MLETMLQCKNFLKSILCIAAFRPWNISKLSRLAVAKGAALLSLGPSALAKSKLIFIRKNRILTKIFYIIFNWLRHFIQNALHNRKILYEIASHTPKSS